MRLLLAPGESIELDRQVPTESINVNASDTGHLGQGGPIE
jgi:hypothetical protein